MKKIIKRIMCLLLAVVLVSSIWLVELDGSGKTTVYAAETVKPVLLAKYSSPATDWESEATPLGNGHMGAMVFGGVGSDKIQINEHTIWSGGPGASDSYDGGMKGTASEIHSALQAARNELQSAMTNFTNNSSAYIDGNGNVVSSNYPDNTSTLNAYLETLKGEKDYFGSYQTLGNIIINDSDFNPPEVINISTNANPSSGSEIVNQLFDGDTGTKWYAGDSNANTVPWIVWRYDQQFSTRQYSLSSANDVQGRDPKSWELYGSNNGSDYTLIDSRSNVTFSERGQTLTFNLNTTVSYTYYRIIITSVHTSGNPCQLSEIALTNANELTDNYSDYQRVLDIDNAVATVSYTKNGIGYEREYFMNNPDNVMVIRLTADKSASISKRISVNTEQPNVSINASGDTITMTGRPSNHGENGLKFAQQVKVIATGGSVYSENGSVRVNNADSVTIIMTAGTNYQQCMDASLDYFTDEDPLDAVTSRISTAVSRGYDSLRERHVDDYTELYDRVTLNICGSDAVPSKTTDQLMSGYNSGNTDFENRYLENLFYQFGRYLLIASSREGTLPANLQGIWAQGLSSPWDADYHTNINLQMNYWLAEQTNLAECHTPVIDYTNSLVARGEIAAQMYYVKQDGSSVRGWTTHHENNIWGNTGPGVSSAFYFQAAAAWMCQDIWEYYQFNMDEDFLRENFDTMLGAALFWVDNLWTDSRDGTLVANPSYSPEHGAYSLGSTSDQAIIWECFEEVLQAAEILNINTSEIEEIRVAQSKLSMPKIGLAGQLQEWKDEVTLDITGDNGHRHVNHLFVLHPGTYVVAGRSEQDDAFVEAAKVTLNTRGDGGTGWSKAWKINMWARLRDGNRAHKLLQEQLSDSTLTNLFDNHPPFQIDGNFGATAGMTEMLLQSQGDSIDLLAALPSSWSSGSYSGLKARGNFEISAVWSGMKANSFTVKSQSGEDCTLSYPKISEATVIRASDNKVVTFTVEDENTISFATAENETYYVTELSTDIKVSDERELLGATTENLYSSSIVNQLGAPSDAGAYITDVALSSMAEHIGLQENDVIVKLNDASVNNTEELEAAYNAVEAGASVKLLVWRGDRFIYVNFTKTVYDEYRVMPGKIEAEDYDLLNGNVRTEPCGEGGENLGYIVNGDYAVYKNVYFSSIPTTFSVRNAGGGTPPITVRLDSVDGPIVAQLNLTATSAYQTYTTSTVNVSNASLLTGLHDIYLCLNTGTNINWISFNGTSGITPDIQEAENGLPNLEITDIGWTPANPVSGDDVTFSATVKNTGDGATPQGTIVGVRFNLNAQENTIAWSDHHTDSINPGESVVLTANGGPSGSNVWTCGSSDAYTIIAYVDDVGRITESNESDNLFSKELAANQALSESDYDNCDLVVSDIYTYSSILAEGEMGTIYAQIKNIGSEPSMPGKTYCITTYIDGRAFAKTYDFAESIAVGETVTVVLSNIWQGTMGVHTVTARVNDSAAIPETDMTNNSKSVKITVKSN